MRIHPWTWCAVLVVLGCFAFKNYQQRTKLYYPGLQQGWPLVFMDQAPNYSSGTILIGPGGGVQYIGIEPFMTQWKYPAMFVDVLLTILAAAAAGIVCQRILHRSVVSTTCATNSETAL